MIMYNGMKFKFNKNILKLFDEKKCYFNYLAISENIRKERVANLSDTIFTIKNGRPSSSVTLNHTPKISLTLKTEKLNYIVLEINNKDFYDCVEYIEDKDKKNSAYIKRYGIVKLNWQPLCYSYADIENIKRVGILNDTSLNIPYGCFFNCENLSKVVFGNLTTNISFSNYAFANCPNLSLVIPNVITDICLDSFKWKKRNSIII